MGGEAGTGATEFSGCNRHTSTGNHRRLIHGSLGAYPSHAEQMRSRGGWRAQRAGWGPHPEKSPTRPLGKGLASTLPRFAEEGYSGHDSLFNESRY
ncbi:hypothetical protein SAMN05519103_00526 [Rhizobiales bacterium GAS113]|nr:hypothetical protein SAMN05519103_00526 [Rhizobiales bacterium GAS113]